MAQVIWTEAALQDLDRVGDYISLDNPDAAKKLVRQCFQRVENLSQHPKLGKTVPELDQSVYRQLVHIDILKSK
ncbi:MAG: type II toxin-antitoxin system RelE/ParE family toxin [Balneolaceae bacterium]|nr:type II toxin-antitoxin system RelE/ParE family toxin [Balneolaceae bacterium]